MTVIAYLDPGSGSMIAGVAAAGAAGVAVAAKSMLYKFKSPLRKKGAAQADPDADQESAVEESTES